MAPHGASPGRASAGAWLGAHGCRDRRCRGRSRPRPGARAWTVARSGPLESPHPGRVVRALRWAGEVELKRRWLQVGAVAFVLVGTLAMGSGIGWGADAGSPKLASWARQNWERQMRIYGERH